MPKAFQLNLIPPLSALWYAYDPASKTELFSSALNPSKQGLLLIDPIELAPAAETDLLQLGPPVAVVITNENHWRAARLWADKFQLPIFADGIPGETNAQHPSALSDHLPGLSVIQIAGAVPGEIAVFSPEAGGTIIVGDALIHFEPYGLALLPKKYCQNQKEMRTSLRQLLERPFERLFFAHGLPILHGATSRLHALLNE